jgi:hypothetical protein
MHPDGAREAQAQPADHALTRRRSLGLSAISARPRQKQWILAPRRSGL